MNPSTHGSCSHSGKKTLEGLVATLVSIIPFAQIKIIKYTKVKLKNAF